MPNYFNVFAQEIAAIFIFFYSIERFSKLVLRENLTKMKELFSKIANTMPKAVLSGFVGVVVLQSSTAVSTLAVSLTNAGVLSIHNAMPIIFGSSIGTSTTAILVSLKWKSMEEIVIIIGGILKFTKRKHLGKTIFYLGLLLFAIEQMTIATSVLKDSPYFQYLSYVENTFALFIIGIVITVILQSSTLVTSILVILISQNGIDMRKALIICIGAFVGTTLTSFVVSLKLSHNARQVGLLNAVISFFAGMINLLFINLFIAIGSSFTHNGFGLAISNTLARVFSACIALAIFYLFDRRKKIIHYVKNLSFN